MDNKTNAKACAYIDLFKAIPETIYQSEYHFYNTADLMTCIRHGLVFIRNGQVMTGGIPASIFDIANHFYGTDISGFNQTFHKSFDTVAEMDPLDYYAEQILHYLSTYGAEAVGVSCPTYIPLETLDIPDFEPNGEKMVIIQIVSQKEANQLAEDFVRKVERPSKRMVTGFVAIVEDIRINQNEIASFELQCIYCDAHHVVPTDPTSALRYLVYNTTGGTLLIKNRSTRQAIENRAKFGTADFHRKVVHILTSVPVERWAEIFFRYKPIFLTYKKFPGCAPIINRIRRAADEYHKPIGNVNVRCFTQLVVNDDFDNMAKVINKASNRELIKLGNVLAAKIAYTGENVAPLAFNIRNGKTFVQGNNTGCDQKTAGKYYHALEAIFNILVNRLWGNLHDKTFYIPSHISYPVPVSEKQFNGNLPWGTVIGAPEGNFEALTVGIHWFNDGESDNRYYGSRVDLDLHLHDKVTHFGWNGSFRNGKNVIYSGDVTDAPKPNGGAEAFSLDVTDEKDPFIVTVNKYCGPEKVDFKFFMTAIPLEPENRRRRDYTFDPNQALFPPVTMSVSEHEATLGLLINDAFYVYGGSLNEGIVPRGNYGDYVEAIAAKLRIMCSFDELLSMAGANVIHDRADIEALPEEEREKVIDLSPEALTATSLFDIIDGKLE